MSLNWNDLTKEEQTNLEEYSSLVGKENMKWEWICHYGKLSEQTLRKYINELDWRVVSRYSILPESFIDDFKDKLIWEELTEYHKFTKEQLYKYVDYIDWNCAPVYQKAVDEEVIDFALEKKVKNFNWQGAIVNIKMTEDYIRKHKDDIPDCFWKSLGYYQDLSESFIKEFSNKLDQFYITFKYKFKKEK